MLFNGSKRRGFSLTEILVVFFIISLLLALLLPVIFGIIAQADSVKCMSNLRQIGMRVQIYTHQWRGLLPHEDNGDTRPPKGCGWYKVLPSKRKGTSAGEDIFQCPSEMDPEARSYKMNSLLESEQMPFVSRARLRPKNLVLFFDGRVNNRGVFKMPKGTWKTASNRHPDGTHYLTVGGEVKSYDSGTDDDGWEDPGEVQWKPR